MTAAPDPTDPQLWMQRAHSNLRLAKIGQMKGVVLVQSRYPGWVEEVTLEGASRSSPSGAASGYLG